GKRREPVFGRLSLALRPFDQQPFFRSALAKPIISMRGTNTDPGKARGQLLRHTTPPLDVAPSLSRQAKCKLLDGDRLVLVIAAHQLWSASVPHPFPWRSRSGAGRPHRRMRLDTNHIAQSQCGDALTQLGIDPI